MSRSRHGIVIASIVIAGVLGIAAAWHHAAHARPGADARVYLAVARQFAAGHGPVMPDGRAMTMRAPLWPMLIGSLMKVFGDPRGAELALRLVAAGVVVAIAVLARWWYGWATGALAVVIAVSAPPLLDVLSDWYADGLALVLAFAGLTMLDAATRRRSMSFAFSAGLVLAAAVLVKESAGFVAAGPVIASLARVDRDGWGWLRPVGAAGFAATAIVTPWLGIHLALEGRFFLTDLEGPVAIAAMLGWLLVVATFALVAWPPRAVRARARGALRHRSSPRTAVLAAVAVACMWTGLITVGLSNGLGFEAQDTVMSAGAIVRGFLLPAFGIPVLAIAGVATLAVGVVRRHRSQLVHAGALIGYLPIMVLWPLNGSSFVARNALIGLVLVHLASAEAAVAVVTAAVRAIRARARAVVLVATVGASVALVASCTWAGVDGTRMRQAKPPTATALTEASVWIRAHVAPGTPVMGSYVDWAFVSRATASAYPVFLTPWTHLEVSRSRPWLRPVSVIPVIGDPEPFNPRTYGNDWMAIRRSRQKGYVVGLSQTALLSALRATHARYLLVSGETVHSTLHIDPVLERVGGLHLVRDFGRTLIFTVDPDHLVPVLDPPIWTDRSTRRWIDRELGIPANAANSPLHTGGAWVRAPSPRTSPPTLERRR